MVSKRLMTNPLALAVLALLDERPMHPYEMGALLRERDKQESIKLNYGSLYTVIEALQRHELVVAQQTERDGRRPERTVYALTDAGRTEFGVWLRALIRQPVKEYTQFAAGLSFLPLLPPEEAAALLNERAQHLAEEIAAARERMNAATQAGVARLFLIEVEHALLLREAELRWTQELGSAIADQTLPGMAFWRTFHAERVQQQEESHHPA